MQERFRDNRSRTDFLYMFTMRRQGPKTETIREYSHELYTLVTKAYPYMPDKQRMEVLKQKVLSSIKLEDFERTAKTHYLTSATHSQVVNIMSRVEEFRKTQEKCQQKIHDDWYLDHMEPSEHKNERQFNNYRRGAYKPRIPDTRSCHYCHQDGHLADRCLQRLEDRKNGVERGIHWPPQRNGRKMCTNCGGNNHTRQECRKEPDYKPSTAFESLPYQTIDKKYYTARSGEHLQQRPGKLETAALKIEVKYNVTQSLEPGLFIYKVHDEHKFYDKDYNIVVVHAPSCEYQNISQKKGSTSGEENTFKP